jgi:hypothetical protein
MHEQPSMLLVLDLIGQEINMSNSKQPSFAGDQTPSLVALSLVEAKMVSGGGSNVLHGNPGGEPASYNVHTSTGPGPAYYNLT